MAADYKRVQDALAEGVAPEALCMTCPWDRYCITPPSMTREEIEAEQEKARLKDQEESAAKKAEGRGAGFPMGMLLTTITLSGKDTAANVCPVFALRLRSSDGRRLADLLKQTMQGWDDNAIEGQS